MTEWLSVERRSRSRRRARSERIMVLLGFSLVALAGSARSTSCVTTARGATYASDDSEVRGLTFSTVRRAQEQDERPPVGLMPEDMTRATRHVLKTEDTRVFLAAGQGFAFLAVDEQGASGPQKSRQGLSTPERSRCLLNTTIRNTGLTLVVGTSLDPTLVVALPDGAHLAPYAKPPAELHEAPNIAVVRGENAVASTWVVTRDRAFPVDPADSLGWTDKQLCLS